MEKLLITLAISFIVFMTIASSAFEWRNPKANRMSLLREIVNVVTFQKLDKYQ